VAKILAKSSGVQIPSPAAQGQFCVARDMLSAPGFAEAWDNLAHVACEPNPFYESWFLGPALQHLDPHSQVSFFTLWEGEPHRSTLLGLMPISNEGVYGRWPIPHIGNWLHHNAFLGTPLVRAGSERIFWQMLLNQMDQQAGKSLFMHINSLAVGGPLQQAFSAVCDAQDRRNALVNQQQRAFLVGPAQPEAYYEEAVRSKKRKELRRQKNRLAEMGDLQFMRSSGCNGFAKWTDEFLQLERAGWKGENASALDCAPETREMFRAALAGAAAQGRLELLDLRLDGKPLAMLVNFLCAPGGFSFKTAFDEEYSRFSPGVLLQIENLSLLTRSEIAWCDSCAAQDHPMIDSLWTDKRQIGRYSVAIGGAVRRTMFSVLLRAEQKRMKSV
jgi:CelD/BcsL family acetyltransferase involved in cellulose biosynthesis